MSKDNIKNSTTQVEKNSRLAFFTEFNPRPVVEVDLKGRVLYANTTAKEVFPDLIKKGSKHPYLADFSYIVKNLKNGQESFSREIKVQDRWFRHFFYYMPKFESIVVYGLDITRQRQDQERIREGEKRYHLLFERMNYGYALQDIIFDEKGKPTDYRFVDVNPAFEKLSGLKKETIIGKTANQLATEPQTPESKKLREDYDKVATTGQPFYFESYNKKAKKYFEMYAYRPNENQIALIFSDITNRKKTDEEKNNFISIMSHELRNPLTPIMANAQFLLSILEQKNILDPVIKESIEIIEKESKVMADLLNDILDVSRLSRQRIKLHKTKVNLYNAINNAIKSSMPFISTKRQRLSVSFGQESLYINADPLRIEQIMVNLINNASKYTQPRGHIRISCRAKNNQAEIKVQDNGIGMSPETISRIFNLFNEESQPFMGIGGLGIGLNIVKNLVLMHGGKINVKSSGKNKGSEFIVRLPLKKRVANTITESPVKETKEAGEKKKYKILVVDDDENIRNAISKILRLQGHIIKATRNGLQAVNLSKSFKPDVALIDVGLPDISGHKVAKMLREQYLGKKIKLIAFTGYGQDKDKDLSKKAGFDHHITKPVDINYLVKLI